MKELKENCIRYKNSYCELLRKYIDYSSEKFIEKLRVYSYTFKNYE